MARSIRDLARDVVASPLGDVIASVGQGVAAAQQALDDASLAKTLEIYAEGDDAALRLLREIGYRPTFYALPETTGEVRIALTLGSQVEGTPVARTATPAPAPSSAVAVQLSRAGRTVGVAPRIYATPVDAGYAGRYGFKADISAKLTFRIVPVPAPNGADELRLVPDLVGRTVAQARDLLAPLALEPRFEDGTGAAIEVPADGANVTAQSPEPGSILRLGDAVSLRLAAEED